LKACRAASSFSPPARRNEVLAPLRGAHRA
jgi:hypothetical protein